MAKAPMKQPHPLHNFPLSLKWGQTATLSTAVANHHHRSSGSRLVASDAEAVSDPESATRPPDPHPPRIGSRSARLQRFSFSSCSALVMEQEKSREHTAVFETEGRGKADKQAAVTVSENNKETGGDVEGEEEKQKLEEEGNSRPWKLRPRRGGILGGKNGRELKEAMLQGNEQKERECVQQLQPKSMRLRGLAESNTGGERFEKKEKRKFWVALSREEIEEDVFIMTGSRPARRPRKRPRNVQKVLDSVFPGLWLVGATADSYKVADVPMKSAANCEVTVGSNAVSIAKAIRDLEDHALLVILCLDPTTDLFLFSVVDSAINGDMAEIS